MTTAQSTTVLAQCIADVIQEHVGALVPDEIVPELDTFLLGYLEKHDLRPAAPLARWTPLDPAGRRWQQVGMKRWLQITAPAA
jgi:hypothetical protein